jgi:hypothetical protein
MAAIEAIIFAAAAGFAFVVVITVIVIVGVHREERHLTLGNRNAPGVIARLARLVLGRYLRREYDASVDRGFPEDRAPPRADRVGTRY